MESPNPMPSFLVVKNGSKSRSQIIRGDAATAIRHHHFDAAVIVRPRLNREMARWLGRAFHRVHSIDDQVQQNLLQLCSVSQHQRKLIGKLRPDLHMPYPGITGNEPQHVRYRGIEVDGCICGSRLRRKSRMRPITSSASRSSLRMSETISRTSVSGGC